jgi:ribonuclease HII
MILTFFNSNVMINRLIAEKEFKKEGYQVIAGCDEAGRGPLAGPVVCAAVVLPPRFRSNGINDSKLLSATKRDELFYYITSKAVAYKIVAIDQTVIDQINILQASLLGMRLAILNMRCYPDLVLVDGRQEIPDLGFPQKAIIKGDRKALSIAAASILAKVARDRIMQAAHEFYPQYNFKQNKGYPTRAHKEAILKYGPTSFHRRSFKFINKAKGIQEQFTFE